MFTDTDSLMYEIKTENVFEDFSSAKELFVGLSQNIMTMQTNQSLEN